MRKLFIVSIFLFFVCMLLAVITYHRLVTLESSISTNWDEIRDLYHEKTNTIPSMITIIKPYTSDDADSFIYIARLRNQYINANSPEEYKKLDKQLDSAIHLTIDSFPSLSSNNNFNNLQNNLLSIDSKISNSINNYNHTVDVYNEALENIPMKWIASILNFEPIEIFNSNIEKHLGPITHLNHNKNSLTIIKRLKMTASRGW